jgi:hypothetical protein
MLELDQIHNKRNNNAIKKSNFKKDLGCNGFDGLMLENENILNSVII